MQETLKDDYTSIELELDRIYEDVRLAQSAELEAEAEPVEERKTDKKKGNRRVMMSPEPPQVCVCVCVCVCVHTYI